MKRSALMVVVLLFAVSALVSGSDAAKGKNAGKTAPRADADIGKEAAIYGPMTVRAVPKKAKPAESPVREEKCFECHDEIQALKKGGKHGKVNCTSCHDGTADHL